MNTTTASRIDSIKAYLASTAPADEYALESLDLDQGDDSAGWLIHTSACNEQGYYDTLRDSSLIIADDWDGVLACSNNGWEWLGIDRCEVDCDLIRDQVTLDRSLSAAEADALARAICREVGIN